MALKKCKECGHEVSTKAKACPNCGAEMKTAVSLKVRTYLAIGIVIVVAIVIAAIAISFLLSRGAGMSARALLEPYEKTAEATTAINSIKMALDMYASDVGGYPTTEQGLKALLEKPFVDSTNNGWNGPYSTYTTFLDPWGKEYVYIAPPKHPDYKYYLYSCGGDGEEGGEDNITSWAGAQTATELELEQWEIEQKRAYYGKLELRNIVISKTTLGRPGIFGEIKNLGDRTLKKVKITVYCLDKTGTPIFEESFHPVLFSQWYGDETTMEVG